MSIAQKGVPKSFEHVQHMMGRVVSMETREKISNATTGISKGFGRHLSEETKRKISESTKGKKKKKGADQQ